MNQITTGVKITVDASELDVKFLKSVEQLNAGLTKTQRALNLTYNEQGLLTNALGQCVEGLSASQIKLGEYVDIMGRVHSMQGGFVEGLNKSQIAMGHYTDELGNIYTAAGVLIGQTEKAAKALREQAKAAKETEEREAETGKSYLKLSELAKEANEALRQAGLSTPFSQSLEKISACVEQVGNLNEAIETLKKAGSVIQKTSLFISQGRKAFTNYNSIILTLIKTFGRLFVAMGPIGWTIAGITAAVSTLSSAYNKITEKPTSDAWSETFQRISDAAYIAGREVETLKDALQFGAGNGKKNDVLNALDEYAAINATGQTREERDAIAHMTNKGGRLLGLLETAAIEFDHLFGSYNGKLSGNDLKDQKAAALDVINKYMEEIQESQKTESQKLQEELTTIHAVEATGELQEAQKKVLKQKAEELSKAIKAETLKEIGVTLEKTPTAAETFNERLTKAAEMYGSGRLTVEELEGAQAELTQAYAKQAAQEAKTRAEIATAQKQLIDAYNAHRIAEHDLNEAAEELRATEKELIEAEKKEIENKIGVSFEKEKELREDYAEKLQTITAAYKEQTITEKEYKNAKEKLAKLTTERAASELGVEFNKEDQTAAVKNKYRKLEELLAEGIINESQFAYATEQVNAAAVAGVPALMELIEAGKKQKTAAEEYAENLKAINQAAEAGIINDQQRRAALAESEKRLIEANNAAAKQKEEEHAALLRALGVDELQSQADMLRNKDNTPYEEAAKVWRQIIDAKKKEAITQEEYNRAFENWKTIKKAQVEEGKAERAKKKADERNAARSELGVDSLMDSLKSPLEKYRETMDQIEKAAKIKAINSDERVALENKAADDYWATMKTAGTATAAAAEKFGKFELAKSIEAGSESLYLAQVRNSTANYQTRIQNSVDKLEEYSSENVYQQQQTNAYLMTIAEQGAGVGAGIWG